MSRIANLRRRPLGIARLPRRSRYGGDPFAVPEPFMGPSPEEGGSILPYWQATELLRCLEILGPDSNDHCRHEVLGEPMPLPEFEASAGISSPVPLAAAKGTGGRRSADVGDLAVTLLPDTRTTDKKMKGRAETEIKFNSYNISWSTDRQGIVTRIVGPGAPTATIQTTYGPGVNAASPSGYGRGTTLTDQANKTTSLGFHEGRHGVDFLRYMAANPFPIFAGTKGMTGDEVQAAADAYRDARAAYSAELNRISTENTDCVGDTKSVSAEVRVVCDAMPAATP